MLQQKYNKTVQVTIIPRQPGKELSVSLSATTLKYYVYRGSLHFMISVFMIQFQALILWIPRHFIIFKKSLKKTITGGPLLTRKSLTQFPLPRFFRVSRGLTTVPLTRISCNTVFSKSQNACKAGTLCARNWYTFSVVGGFHQ